MLGNRNAFFYPIFVISFTPAEFFYSLSNMRQVKNIEPPEFVILLTHIHISGKVHLNAEYLKNFSTDKFLSVQYPSNTPPSAKLGLCRSIIYSKFFIAHHIFHCTPNFSHCTFTLHISHIVHLHCTLHIFMQGLP